MFDDLFSLVAVHAGEETAQKTSSQPFCVPSGASYADQNILKFNTCIERYDLSTYLYRIV